MSRARLGAWALAAALTAASGAWATTVVQLPIEVLAEAPVVVRGVVTAAAVRPIDPAPGVVTDYTIVVAENLAQHGFDNVEVLTVRIPGGRSAAHDVRVEGMPELTVGEHVVLFLEPIAAFDDPFYIPFGLNQGVWRQAADGAWSPATQDGLIGAAPAQQPLSLAALRTLVVHSADRPTPTVTP